MPLIKSPTRQARSANIKKEIQAGKPPKEAAAIGYSEQRREQGKKAATSRKRKGK